MRSKRYRALKEKIDSAKTYTLDEAVAILSSGDNTKLSSGVELHVKCGIDVKQSDQQIRGTVLLPHGSGKTRRIAVLTEKVEAAKASGAALAGGEELINEIKAGKIDFDVLVAEPAFMPKLAPVAKILGPRGLMPSPKDGTVSADAAKAVKELSSGKVSFKNDDTGNIHLLVGRVSFPPEELKKNIQAAFDAIKASRPATMKGSYILRTTLCTTMGPGIKVAF